MAIMDTKTTTLDRFGRVVIPKKVRAELGLSPGDPLKVESRDDGILISPVQEEPHLVNKEGVLVFSGSSFGDLSKAVRKQREERLDLVSGTQK